MTTTYTRGLGDMPISFPGLFGDKEFNIDPVAIDIGGGVYWYGILIACGLLLAVWFCSRQAPRYGLTADHTFDAVLFGVPAALVGARAYYVIFYLSQFRSADGKLDWGQVIAIWDGGLAIYGGVIAAFVAGAIYCRVKKLAFWAMTDMAVPGFLIGQAIGRWGNFINREAFGSLTDAPWRMKIWVTATTSIEVHPTFLYESLWNLLGLALLCFVVSRHRRFDGESTCFYFLWYGAGRFWIEGLRTDSLYLFDWTVMGQPVRVSQALSLVMMLVSLVVLGINLRRPSAPEKLYVNRITALPTEETTEDAPAETGAPVPEEETVQEDGAQPKEVPLPREPAPEE